MVGKNHQPKTGKEPFLFVCSTIGKVIQILNCDVIVEDAPQRGTWNMAVDEALLEAAAKEGQCTLRWYRWAEPTVSLGYFQSPENHAEQPELAELPFVKRLSGGGAILHHHELTYSAAISAAHPLARTPGDLYGAIHRRIADVLSKRGIPARLRGEEGNITDQSFLCFCRGDANDLVVGGHKIVGSAQRRRRGAVLQHGSLILKSSPLTPQIVGLSELGFEMESPLSLAQELADCVTKALGTPIFLNSPHVRINEVARELEQNRYQQKGWSG